MRDYDLLAGILASQLRLVSRGTLVRYAALLAQQPGLSLLSYLDDSKALSDHDQELLCRIVDSIVHAHKGDEKAALRAFGGDDAASEAFAGSLALTEQGWGPTEDQTILSRELPHGLPAQITPETIGRYTRGSEYARGGIGRILLVHDEQIGRDVILKELLPEHTTSPTDSTLSRLPEPDSPRSPMRQSAAMMARFLQEAKVTGQLEHPSIVPVYELGTRKDGQLYYTMKLVRGETLSESIKKCRDARDRLGLLRPFLDVCNAMAYAHSKGVIHRDLKPSNIMVGEFGECVVLDWGLAKMQKDVDAHREALEKTISQLKLGDEKSAELRTRSKDILGTPLYMAPEQARGEVDAVGVQSDVYSLGVILFEILTGELPHPWTNSIDTIRRVGTLPAPPIRKTAPHTPPELAAICDKALAFHAKKRYASARELAADIQSFLEGAVVGAYAYSFFDMLARLYRKHKPIILTATTAAALLLVLGTVSYIQIYRARDAERIAKENAQDQRDEARRQETEAQRQRKTAEDERKRAEAAEERTAREKYVSDIRLADAYIRDFKFQAAEDTLLATEPRYRNIEWGFLVAQCHQELATLSGHTNVVFKSFYAPDGNTIVTVGGDFSARLWNAESFEQVHEWRFPNIYLRHATFDQTGARLALCLSDGTVRIVDPTSGNELSTLTGHSAPVNYCVFDETGEHLLTASSDRTAHLWSLESNTIVKSLGTHGDELKAAGFCDNGSKFYTVTSGAVIRLIREDGETLAEAPGMGVSTTPDAPFIVARTGRDGVLYAPDTLKEIGRLTHEAEVSRITYYPDRDRVVTACEDGNARVWTLPDGRIEQVFNVGYPLRDARLSPDGRHLAALAFNGLGVVWERETSREVNRFSGHRMATAGLEFKPSGDRLLTCAMDGTARIWDAFTNPLYGIASRGPAPLQQLSLARDTGTAAIAARSGQLRVQHLDTSLPLYVAEFQEQIGGLKAAVSPDGKNLVVVPDEFLPILLSLPDGKVIRRLDGHDGYISHVAYSPDGAFIVTSSWDDTVRIWNGTTGAPISTLTGHQDTVYCAAVSPDGAHIASGSRDKTAIVWERVSGTPAFTIEHNNGVYDVAFSPDGRLVATASRDGVTQVWDLTTKSKLHYLSQQNDDIERVLFTADSQRVLTLSTDRRVRVWELTQGQALLDMEVPQKNIVDMATGNAPHEIYLAGDDGEVLRVRMPAFAPPIPPADADALKKLVVTTRAETTPPHEDTASASNPTRIARILPRDTALQSLAKLASTAQDTEGSDSVTISDDKEPWTKQLGLRAGDTLLSIDGLPREELSSHIDQLTAATPDENGQELYLDLVRELTPLRLQLALLPVKQETRTVQLTQEQATALLQQAVEFLTKQSESIVQVNRRWVEYAGIETENPDALDGLWINAPTDRLGKQLLRTAGLRPAERVVSINNIEVKTLSKLAELTANGLKSVDTSQTLNLRLAQGAFGNIALQVSSHLNP